MDHDKGRDCARSEEVLDNYRRRALRAERLLIEVLAQVASERAPA